MRQRLAVVGFVLGIIVLGAAPAQAATFTVNSTADTVGTCPSASSCTLRTALDAANTAAGDDTITFSLPASSTISLTGGPLAVSPTAPTDVTTITGPGANQLTVRRDPSAAPSEVIDTYAPATISGLTISGGISGPFSGAALNVNAALTLDGVAVTGNTANAGGGAGGSAVIVNYGDLRIRNSTLSGNTVTDAGTGLSASAIIDIGVLSIVNSTISGNVATGTGPAAPVLEFGAGGATILNTTISANSSGGGSGGVFVAAPSIALANSIVAGNTVAGSPSDCNGTLTSQGYNLLGTNAGCTMVAATGDQIGTMATPINPLLGPLGNNGGPTQTMVPLAGSPAIDAGNPAATSDADPPVPPALVPCRTTDQRGIARPGGPRCDIGAVEIAGVAADYPTVVLADAPAGYWRFNELSGTTAFDSSGNGNNGSYLNGPLLGQAGAFAGSGTAASFDGVNDLVRVPDSNSLDVGDTFTLEGWVKRSSTSGSQTLFNKGGNGIQATVMSAANGNQVWLRKANVTTIARSSIGIPADGHFHYIVVTKNGTGAGSVKIYIDNVESTTLLAPAQIIANTAFPLEISGGASNQHVYDEFALYDGVLSAARVAAHFTTAGPALAALLSSQSSGESGTTTAAGRSQASSPSNGADAWVAAAAAAR